MQMTVQENLVGCAETEKNLSGNNSPRDFDGIVDTMDPYTAC